MSQLNKRLIWIDLEMTGLDTENDKIIEVATIVTDSNLNIIAEGPEIAIYQTDEILAGMDDWNTKQHARSGLVERVKTSQINESEAERLTLEFLSQYLTKNTSPMCGNSICQDRRFLYRCMPNLEAFFHYRNLDVSSVNELAKYWHPEMLKEFKKLAKHRALDDIKDSINELKLYQNQFFNLSFKPLNFCD